MSEPYLLYTFESLHNFHQGILELLEEAVVNYIGSQKLMRGRVDEQIYSRSLCNRTVECFVDVVGFETHEDRL